MIVDFQFFHSIFIAFLFLVNIMIIDRNFRYFHTLLIFHRFKLKFALIDFF